MSMLRSLRATLAIICIATTVVACGKGTTDNSQCLSWIKDYSSPAPGYLTLTGGFYSNESILIRDSGGNLLASGTPATDRSSFTFSGLPSGARQLTIIASCDAGQRQIDQGAYTIK